MESAKKANTFYQKNMAQLRLPEVEAKNYVPLGGKITRMGHV
jgi:hypothetical protein